MKSRSTVIFFFFQAEDGIRDHCVTGVQTCALPISTLATPIQIGENFSLPEQMGEAILARACDFVMPDLERIDRKSTRLNSSHTVISYAVFCLKKKNITRRSQRRTRRPIATSADDPI